MRRSTRRSRTRAKRHRQRTRRGGEEPNWNAYSQHLGQAMKPESSPPRINWNSYSQHLGNAMKLQPNKAKDAPKPINRSGYSIPVNTKAGQELSNMIYNLESRYKTIYPPKKPQPPGIVVTHNRSKTPSVGVGNPIRRVGF